MKKIQILLTSVIFLLGFYASAWANAIYTEDAKFRVGNTFYDLQLEETQEDGKVAWNINSQTFTTSSWQVTVSGKLNPDPYISYVIGVQNFSSNPLSFLFSFIVPISIPNVSTLVQGSIVGGLTDTTGDGISIFPTAFDVQHSYVFTPQTSMGVDVGKSVVAGAGSPGALYNYGPYIKGIQPGPGGPWIAFMTTAGFQLSGNNDIAALTGYSSIDPVPEPATMILLGTGLIGLASGFRKKLRRQ
jgi:hypothetical protein